MAKKRAKRRRKPLEKEDVIILFGMKASRRDAARWKKAAKWCGRPPSAWAQEVLNEQASVCLDAGPGLDEEEFGKLMASLQSELAKLSEEQGILPSDGKTLTVQAEVDVDELMYNPTVECLSVLEFLYAQIKAFYQDNAIRMARKKRGSQ